jgi:hypothetical protein
VVEKYGFNYLIEGIHNLINFDCNPCYILGNGRAIKIGHLKEKK